MKLYQKLKVLQIESLCVFEMVQESSRRSDDDMRLFRQRDSLGHWVESSDDNAAFQCNTSANRFELLGDLN